MGCGASTVVAEDGENGPPLSVTPPAEILFRDYSSMLTLRFRGEGLNDGERSFLVVYTKASGETLWTELGKTEVCSLDTTWPVWGTVMELEFRVEVMRHLRLEAYKMMRSASLDNLWEHKFIGACEFMLTEAVTSRAKVSACDGWLRKKLLNIRRKRGEKHPGKVCIFADEKHSSKLELYFKLRAKDLKSPEFWKRKPDPFFTVNRMKVTGVDECQCEELEMEPVYRSEVARHTGDPRFLNSVLTVAQVGRGIAEQDFVITVTDWNRSGGCTVLGEAVLNFGDVWRASGERNLQLPICTREGPRFHGMLRNTQAQIRKHRALLRPEKRSPSGTFARLTTMGSATFGKTLTRSFSRTSANKSRSSSLRDELVTTRSLSEASESSESSSRPATQQESFRESLRSSLQRGDSKISASLQRGDSKISAPLQRGESKRSISRGESKISFSQPREGSTISKISSTSQDEEARTSSRKSLRATSQAESKKRLRKARSGIPTELADKTLYFGPQVGLLTIHEMILDRTYTFLDYVRGGLELRMMFGLDFTRSNMDTANPDSLHSLCEKGMATAYEDAIVSLGSVLKSYDTSNEYFVYGFGAKIPPSHTVCSNCFALTGDFLYPKVKGLEGILQAYRRTLNVVSLHGPSDCSEVLRLAGRFSRKFVQEPEKEMLRSSVPPDMIYFVLLILTDGDMESEKGIVEELRELQAYPISVVLIGIGSKDFKFMRELPDALALHFEKDFEKPKLDNLSAKACRRVVQFVQYSEYESDPDGLVAATLADLPREVVLYYRMLGVKPRGLDRFENKFGEAMPTPMPKAAAFELKAAEQRTEDRKAREKTLANKASAKEDSETASLERTTSRTSRASKWENFSEAESLAQSQSPSHLSLAVPPSEESEQKLMDFSSSSEDEAPKKKRDEENLPVFLQEERTRLLTEAMAIGYRKHQITRAMRDGIAAASVDVLLDNIRYSGYGKLPSYKDAAVASLPDDAPLPWNPFKTQEENERKVKQLDDELEDYGAQLRALTNPQRQVTRQDVLAPAGVFSCRRSRIAPPIPRAPSPFLAGHLPGHGHPPLPESPSPSLHRGNSGLSNKTLSKSMSLSGLRLEDEDRDRGDAVEEAARRLRSLKSSPVNWPSIQEGDEPSPRAASKSFLE